MKRGTVVVGYLDDGHWSACFGLSYRDLLLHDMMGSNRIIREGGKELRQLCGTGGIVAGRNKVTEQFLDATDGEWLWFIDTDMGFGADTVDRLVGYADQYRKPVVGGLCFKLTRQARGEFHAEKWMIQPTVYDLLEVDGEIGFLPRMGYERDTVVPAAGTGAACLLIHRRVLERVRAEHGDVWFDPITHPTGLKGKPRTFSEDLSFCVRLQSVDVPVHVATGVRTCHEKGGVFLDEDAFDRQQAAKRSADAAA